MHDYIDIAMLALATMFFAGHNKPQQLPEPVHVSVDYRDSLEAMRADFKKIADSAAVLYVEADKMKP